MSQTERVHRGATLLDEQRPGWAAAINVARLDLASPWECVLGQIGGGEPGCFNDLTEALGLDTMDALRAHGFEREQTEAYSDLREPWVAEITARQA